MSVKDLNQDSVKRHLDFGWDLIYLKSVRGLWTWIELHFCLLIDVRFITLLCGDGHIFNVVKLKIATRAALSIGR